MGPLGWQETLVIFILALLIFGPKKLPELGKTIGKALTEFRRASSELKSTWDREMVNLERENESLKDVATSIQNELSEYDSSYSYGPSCGDPSYDSPAESPSTVSASATEGAELTEYAAPEQAYAPAEDAGGHEGTFEEPMVASAGEPDQELKPAGVAESGSNSESPAAAG